MTINGLDLNSLDSLYECLDVKINGKISSYRINNLERLKRWVGRLIKKIKSLFVQDIEANLSNLSIGGVFRATKSSKPSEVINIILEELNLPFPSNKDIPLLFFQWNSELNEIGELFKQTEIKDSEGNSAYSKASKEVDIPSFPIIIDQISQRLHISWEEASNIKWSEVYLMMMIDKKNYIFQKEFNKQMQLKYKK